MLTLSGDRERKHEMLVARATLLHQHHSAPMSTNGGLWFGLKVSRHLIHVYNIVGFDFVCQSTPNTPK